MRTLTVALTNEKNKLSMASAWLPLITVEIDASTILRLVPNPTSITFDGQTYTPFGCTIDEVTSDAKGGLHDVTIAVSNVTREISSYIETREMRGVKVGIRYVNSANLADASAVVIDEHYEIMSIQVKGSQFVAFNLGHDRINSQIFPSGKFYRDNCRWIYKSNECGYSGGIASCDKVLEGSNGCRAHDNVARFGGFPALIVATG